MTIFTITMLLTIIFVLVIYGRNMSQRNETKLVIQKDEWAVQHNSLQLRLTEYKARDCSIRKLQQEKKDLFQKIDTIENKRDSLAASLAALETQVTNERCETLEKECKCLAKKVVSLHQDNTAIKIELDSYHDYAKRRNQAISSTS